MTTAETISAQYSLPIELNDRNDLFLNNKKVSGSASRLIRRGELTAAFFTFRENSFTFFFTLMTTAVKGLFLN